MAMPDSANEVTVRRLASLISQLWTNIKDTFASKSHTHLPTDIRDPNKTTGIHWFPNKSENGGVLGITDSQDYTIYWEGNNTGGRHLWRLVANNRDGDWKNIIEVPKTNQGEDNVNFRGIADRAYKDRAGNVIDETYSNVGHKHLNYDDIVSDEGTSDVTDMTEILTSYADNVGYSESHPETYRRRGSSFWNYIKGKLSGSDVNIGGSAAKSKALGFYQVPTTSGYPNLDNAMSSGYSQFCITDFSYRTTTECGLNLSTMQEGYAYELNFTKQKTAVLKIVNDLTVDRYVHSDFENKTLKAGENVSYTFPVGARINMIRNGADYYFNNGAQTNADTVDGMHISVVSSGASISYKKDTIFFLRTTL